MESTAGIGAAPTTSGSISSGSLSDVGVDDFFKLMIAELQNQDPLDPMKNSEMVEQLNQIRSMDATDKLTATLDAVLVGQNLTTASSLIGKEISALTDDSENIEGVVDRITVEANGDDGSRTVRVHVGEHSVDLKNVRAIQSLDPHVE